MLPAVTDRRFLLTVASVFALIWSSSYQCAWWYALTSRTNSGVLAAFPSQDARYEWGQYVMSTCCVVGQDLVVKVIQMDDGNDLRAMRSLRSYLMYHCLKFPFSLPMVAYVVRIYLLSFCTFPSAFENSILSDVSSMATRPAMERFAAPSFDARVFFKSLVLWRLPVWKHAWLCNVSTKCGSIVHASTGLFGAASHQSQLSWEVLRFMTQRIALQKLCHWLYAVGALKASSSWIMATWPVMGHCVFDLMYFDVLYC